MKTIEQDNKKWLLMKALSFLVFFLGFAILEFSKEVIYYSFYNFLYATAMGIGGFLLVLGVFLVLFVDIVKFIKTSKDNKSLSGLIINIFISIFIFSFLYMLYFLYDISYGIWR